MAVGKGSGTTFAFAGFTYNVTHISLDGVTVPDVSTGGLADTIRTYEPGNIVDWGTITAEFEFDTDNTDTPMPPAGTADTIVIDVRGEGAGSILTASAFIENISFGIPLDEVMPGTCVFRLTSSIAQT